MNRIMITWTKPSQRYDYLGSEVPGRSLQATLLQLFVSEAPLPVLEKIEQFLERYLKFHAYLIKVVGSYNCEWYIVCFLFLRFIMYKVFITDALTWHFCSITDNWVTDDIAASRPI